MSVETRDQPMTMEAVENRTIMRCIVGSTALGVNVDDQADRDELGVCVEPAEYVCGLSHFEQLVHRTQPQGVRSGPGDLDLTVYGLRKFCSLALKGNPSILLLFNVPDDGFSTLAPSGVKLRSLAWAFASRRSGSAFLGYMQQQRQRLQGERGQMNVKRPELVEAYGYDTKYASHVLRLGLQGIDYMTSGSFPVPMPPDQRDLVLSVRRGEMTEHQAMTRAGEIEAELKAAMDSSPLPERPAFDVVNDFLVKTYRRVWDSGARVRAVA